MDSFSVPVKELAEIAISVNFIELTAVHLLNYIKEQYNVDSNQIKFIEDKLCRYFLPWFKKKWISSFYQKNTFERNNIDWLTSNFTVDFKPVKVGRKSQDDFEESSKSTKRRKIQAIQENYTANKNPDSFS